jgi:cytochrome c oxidase subunit 3
VAETATIEDGIELAEQFSTVDQQRRVGMLGMWAWLVTELLLFAGLFLVALVLRLQHPESVQAVAGRLKMWIGATNTVILIVSSLAMTGAIESSKMGRGRDSSRCLLAAAALGAAFMALKSFEYYEDWSEHMMPFLNRPYALAGDNASMLFANLYYVTTILHAVHLTIGISLALFMARAVVREGYLERRQNRVEIVGLYWHFIDLIWLIAFPTLYLVNR